MFTPSPLRRNLGAAIRDLSSSKHEVRASAARDLAIAGHDDVVTAAEALVAALGDNAPNVRAEAALALGTLGARNHVDAIAPLVKDSETAVRQYAVLALGQMGGERARALLEETWRDGEPDARFQALRGMAGIDPRRAFEWALESANDPDPWIASEASLQLGELFAAERDAENGTWSDETDRARAREKLRGLLDTSSQRVSVCASLALASLDDDRGREILTRFVSRDLVLEKSDDEGDLRFGAIEALGRLGGDAARAALEKIAWRMLPSLDRDLARAALARMGDARACATVMEMLGSRWGATRQAAVALAANGRVVAAVPVLVEMLRTNRAEPGSLVAALAVMPDAGARAALADYARDGSDADARAAAAEAVKAR